MQTNFQTTAKKKKYLGKIYGGAPPYFDEHKYLWGGPPILWGGPPIGFINVEKYGGAPPYYGGAPP